MRIERLRCTETFKRNLPQSKSAIQKPVRTGGINDETRANGHALSLALAKDHRLAALKGHLFKLCLVEILHPGRLDLANQKMVEVRPIPMRVGDFITRAGRHEQLVPPTGIIRKRLAELVMIKL